MLTFRSLFVIATINDKPMKNKSANMLHHNGRQSCTYCLHPGVNIRTDNGGNIMAFPPAKDRGYRLRTNLTYTSALSQLSNNGKKMTYFEDSFRKWYFLF